MATAPTVQTLAQAMADLDPAYAASRSVVERRRSALPQKYEAARAGIYAERGEGFNAINNQATGRGASFSGIPQDEQARYLSTKFLPGLQQADFQQNEEDMRLEGELGWHSIRSSALVRRVVSISSRATSTHGIK